MSFVSEVDKVESFVNLPLVLKVLGVVVLVLTVWKGVHGFFPTFGLIAGAAMIFVGGEFNKIYR
jgi:hypothetical protein